MTDAARIRNAVGDRVADVRNVHRVIGELVQNAGEDFRHVAVEARHVLVMRVRDPLHGDGGVARAARRIARAPLELRVGL
jgi:hypothetical protein